VSAFEARALSFSYSNAAAPALTDIDATIAHGELCAVIGPNGSGKSTLLRLLLGAEPPGEGEALFEGRASTAWDRAEIARSIGVVTQFEDAVFPMTVRELVGMGRYPHLGAYRREGDVDRAAVDAALSRCSLDGVAHRAVQTLSGGERQRARIARALAQQPRVLVLDEPTAALDVAYEMSIFELLAALVRDSGVTVVLATHNINLAARYATRIMLLESGRLVAYDEPRAVVTQSRIENTYHWPVSIHPFGGPGPDTGAPQIAPLRKEGQ
jgi:iron complex transport system ATP-binding protein